MIQRLIILILVFIQVACYGQTESVWNLMLLKKDNRPEIKDDMTKYNPTGFYLYRNCFYDLEFRDKTERTLRLIDIRPDTLIFIGISDKRDIDLSIIAKDTFFINYRSIDKFIFLKEWSTEASKKIKCDDHYFIFHKLLKDNKYESKYGYVFSSKNLKNELVPRLGFYGIIYYFEYGGKLYYHSGIDNDQIPKYSDDDKVKALNAAVAALDLIVNKK